MRRDSAEVEAALAAIPQPAQGSLRALRAMICAEADALGLGDLESALKWGQPSYVVPGAGTPIRLGLTKTGAPALFVHCGTSLIEDFQGIAAPGVRTEGRRAALIGPEGPEPLRPLIRAALAYRRRRAP
ncbi:MAG: DUF1801 domain-containing protein [Pikeienuella sp.]